MSVRVGWRKGSISQWLQSSVSMLRWASHGIFSCRFYDMTVLMTSGAWIVSWVAMAAQSSNSILSDTVKFLIFGWAMQEIHVCILCDSYQVFASSLFLTGMHHMFTFLLEIRNVQQLGHCCAMLSWAKAVLISCGPREPDFNCQKHFAKIPIAVSL